MRCDAMQWRADVCNHASVLVHVRPCVPVRPSVTCCRCGCVEQEHNSQQVLVAIPALQALESRCSQGVADGCILSSSTRGTTPNQHPCPFAAIGKERRRERKEKKKKSYLISLREYPTAHPVNQIKNDVSVITGQYHECVTIQHTAERL